MYYKKKGKPEIDEVVICTVKKILYHSVFVSMDEYPGVDGMIHISEIAPGRIRNLRDYVIEGKRVVCKVLSINQQGNIDLSLRRVPLTVSINKIIELKQDEKAEKLLEAIGKEVGFDLRKVYDNIGFKIIENYGRLYPFLQEIVDKGKPVIDALKPDVKFGDLLLKTVKEKIKPIEVSITGTLNLINQNGNGIESVKEILLKAECYKVKISYLGAPKYKLEIISRDYKTAETSLKGYLDVAEALAKKTGSEFNFIKND